MMIRPYEVDRTYLKKIRYYKRDDQHLNMTQHAKSRKEGKITNGLVLAPLETGMSYKKKKEEMKRAGVTVAETRIRK